MGKTRVDRSDWPPVPLFIHIILYTIDIHLPPNHPPGFKMPMCCSQTERRDVERIISNAKLRGTYLPLRNMAMGRWATLRMADLATEIRDI